MEKRFFTPLTDEDRLRHVRYIERSKVIWFTVQYEALLKGKWTPLARYDTAHGYFHMDIIHADGSVTKRRMSIVDFNDAYTLADLTLKSTFKTHKERFIKEMEG